MLDLPTPAHDLLGARPQARAAGAGHGLAPSRRSRRSSRASSPRAPRDASTSSASSTRPCSTSTRTASRRRPRRPASLASAPRPTRPSPSAPTTRSFMLLTDKSTSAPLFMALIRDPRRLAGRPADGREFSNRRRRPHTVAHEDGARVSVGRHRRYAPWASSRRAAVAAARPRPGGSSPSAAPATATARRRPRHSQRRPTRRSPGWAGTPPTTGARSIRRTATAGR